MEGVYYGELITKRAYNRRDFFVRRTISLSFYFLFIRVFIVKTIEFDEIIGHIPEFLAQVLAPMLLSGEILSIHVVKKCSGESRNVPEGTWMLRGGIEIPCIYQIYGCKKKKQNIRAVIRNATLWFWILYIIFKHTTFIFSQKGLISKGACHWRDLYASNLMGLYSGGPITERAYNRDFTVFEK